MCDQFFDCLNVRHPTEYIQRRKPNIKPYTSIDDERFTVCCYCCSFLLTFQAFPSQWLEEDFLGYLNEVEESVNSLEDAPETEKVKMLFSCETIEGLQVSSNMHLCY